MSFARATTVKLLIVIDNAVYQSLGRYESEGACRHQRNGSICSLEGFISKIKVGMQGACKRIAPTWP